MTKEEAIKSFEEENRTMLENKTAYINELKARGMEFEDRMVSYIDESVERNDVAISALKGGWIPIEEREPDNVHERVYVTQLVPKSPCKPNGTTVYITRFIDLHEKKKYITAWQPLPEPYKKGE